VFRSRIVSEPERAPLRSDWRLTFPRLAACLLFAVVLGSGAAARGDDKKGCLDAYREAQRARRDEALLRAREQLLVCARPECPLIVQNDCIPWLADVQKAVPSVVLSARAADGRDLVDVRVTMDGRPLAVTLDGKSLDVDPGVHEFRFEAPGFPPAELRVLVQKAEKDRLVRVTMAAAPSGAVPSTPEPAQTEVTRPVPGWAWVAAGAGLAGWGGLAYFGIRFDQKYDDLRACEPSCPSSQVDAASATRTLAFVSLGIGAVGTAAAVALYLTRPEVSVPARTRDKPVGLGVAPAPGGGMAVLGGVF
jgi:hypothetical protein